MNSNISISKFFMEFLALIRYGIIFQDLDVYNSKRIWIFQIGTYTDRQVSGKYAGFEKRVRDIHM